MAGPNFVTGWTSASLAPRTGHNFVAPTAPAPGLSSLAQGPRRTEPNVRPNVTGMPNPTALGTPSAVSPGVLANPSAVATGINNLNGQQTGISTLRDAALGSRDPLQSLGLGRTGITASTYAHPDAPAFLADAVANLNGSPGFAQQNLTNLLLQQIMQNKQMTLDTHDTAAAHQEAKDKAMIANAKAVAAANDHQTQLRLHALHGAMTAPTPVGTGAQSASPINNSGWAVNSGWNSPEQNFFNGAYTKALAGGDVGQYPIGSGSGWAPGTVNGMY